MKGLNGKVQLKGPKVKGPRWSMAMPGWGGKVEARGSGVKAAAPKVTLVGMNPHPTPIRNPNRNPTCAVKVTPVVVKTGPWWKFGRAKGPSVAAPKESSSPNLTHGPDPDRLLSVYFNELHTHRVDLP